MTDEPKQLMRIEQEVAKLRDRIEEVAEAPLDTEEIDVVMNAHETRLDEYEKRIQALERQVDFYKLEIRALKDRSEGAIMLDQGIVTEAVASALVRRMTRVKTVMPVETRKTTVAE